MNVEHVPPPLQANERLRRGALVLVVLLGLAAFWMPTSSALGADVPPDRQALILARALSYDRNLKGRAGEKVTIAVVYQDDNGSSKSTMEAIVSAFQKTTKLKVQGLPIRAVPVAYGSDDLEAIANAEGTDAFYICPGLAGDLASILSVSRRKDIATLGGSADYAKAGVSVVVVSKGTKASLMVNLPSSKAEGMDLSPELLELAEVIK